MPNRACDGSTINWRHGRSSRAITTRLPTSPRSAPASSANTRGRRSRPSLLTSRNGSVASRSDRPPAPEDDLGCRIQPASAASTRPRRGLVGYRSRLFERAAVLEIGNPGRSKRAVADSVPMSAPRHAGGLGGRRLTVGADRTRRTGVPQAIRRSVATAICAFRPAGVDVNLPLQIATLDASIGRTADISAPNICTA
jgi:hypothetical protein